MSPSIRQQVLEAGGSEIVTDIQLDLANASDPCSSFSTAAVLDASGFILGVSSSTGTHGNAQILQINSSGSTSFTSNGVVTAGELICVEEPAGGAASIGLYRGNAASGSGGSTADASNLIEMIAFASQTIGKNGTFDVDVDIDNQYLYLASTGSTNAAYTSGKFVLRLFGYQIFDDVS